MGKKENEMSEICNECGRSVNPGSGDFVNRVPDCNTPEERKEMGKQFPEGDFLCPECDSNADKEVYLELHCALENDDVDMSLSTLFFRGQRMREIEEEYNTDIGGLKNGNKNRKKEYRFRKY